MATKQEILKEKLEEYLQADKAGKGLILNQVEAVSRMNRKAIIRRFRRLQLRPRVTDHRGRPEVYDMRVTLALKEVWQIANEICAERLHPMIAEYISVLKRDQMWGHDQMATQKLCVMSLGTMKDRIAEFAKSKARGGRSATKPTDLREIIPIRRGPWKNPDPGYGEVDTVAHCGASLAGDYAYSVQYTDVSLIWTCLSAQWNKGEKATRESIERIKRRLPFPLLGIDPDSGGEFINWLLKDWCDQQHIAMTRTRPYCKNDHARIEQKNYTNIRDFLGYTRIEDHREIKFMNELYDYVEDYINFFLSSQKCIKKERRGSKYKRIYDKAQTAYQRVLACLKIAPEVKDKLRSKYATLNPKVLKDKIDILTKKILTNTHY
ncbi:MAG: hypothetical protein EPN89_08975 [Methylovulum sp.]|nr:MAG: hypothetical protein EPN89_08975 [Methylovulum sp.]